MEIEFSNPIPSLGNGDGLESGVTSARTPSSASAAALEALAEISQNQINDNERTVIRIIDLLADSGDSGSRRVSFTSFIIGSKRRLWMIYVT